MRAHRCLCGFQARAVHPCGPRDPLCGLSSPYVGWGPVPTTPHLRPTGPPVWALRPLCGPEGRANHPWAPGTPYAGALACVRLGGRWRPPLWPTGPVVWAIRPVCGLGPRGRRPHPPLLLCTPAQYLASTPTETPTAARLGPATTPTETRRFVHTTRHPPPRTPHPLHMPPPRTRNMGTPPTSIPRT